MQEDQVTPARNAARSRAGISLVELLVFMALLGVILAVMAALGPELIGRVARGEEPLTVKLAVAGEVSALPEDGATGEETVMLLTGNEVKTLSGREDVSTSLSAEVREDAPYYEAGGKWQEIPISDRVQIGYRGVLSPSQLEELKIVSRILQALTDPNRERSIVE